MPTFSSLLLATGLVVLAVQPGFAQSSAASAQHNAAVPNSNCRFAKNPCRYSEGCATCLACRRDRQKANAAARAARNQVEHARAQQGAAADLARAKAAQQARQAQRKAAAGTNVTIEAGGLASKATPATRPAASLPASQNKLYMGASDHRGFYNVMSAERDEKNASYRKSLDVSPSFRYEAVEGAFADNATGAILHKFPANVGVVRLYQEQIDQHTNPLYTGGSDPYYYQVMDLVDDKLNRLFNSPAVAHVEQLYGEWFVVGYNYKGVGYHKTQFESAKLYNVQTKAFMPITEKGSKGVVIYSNFRGNNNHSLLAASNARFWLGSYNEASKRSKHEELFDGVLGGPGQWKALLVAQPEAEGGGTIYYVDANDKIAKRSIDASLFMEFGRWSK